MKLANHVNVTQAHIRIRDNNALIAMVDEMATEMVVEMATATLTVKATAMVDATEIVMAIVMLINAADVVVDIVITPVEVIDSNAPVGIAMAMMIAKDSVGMNNPRTMTTHATTAFRVPALSSTMRVTMNAKTSVTAKALTTRYSMRMLHVATSVRVAAAAVVVDVVAAVVAAVAVVAAASIAATETPAIAPAAIPVVTPVAPDAVAGKPRSDCIPHAITLNYVSV